MKKREVDYPEPEPVSICPICDRILDKIDLDRHHLVPVHKGGARGDKIDIHRFCHTKLHSVFTNNELAKKYNTAELIRAHPLMLDFIEWVKDKPSSFYLRNAESKVRKRR